LILYWLLTRLLSPAAWWRPLGVAGLDRERVPPVAAGWRARLRTTATAPGEPETDAGR